MVEPVKSREREVTLLLEIADACGEKAGGKRAASSLSRLAASPLFQEYGLSEKEITIVAILFGDILDGEERMEGRAILRKLEPDREGVFLQMENLSRLKELKILEVVDEEMEHVGLLRTTVTLSNWFLDRIYETTEAANREVAPYSDNFEYLADQIERIRILKEESDDFLIKPSRFRRLMRRPMSRRIGRRGENESLRCLEERIAERLARTKESFPLEELKKSKNLSREEELIVIALLEEDGTDGAEEVEDLLAMISRTPRERWVHKKLFKEEGRLFKAKMIKPVSHGYRFKKIEEVTLDDDLRARLLGEKKKRSRKGLKDDDFFEVIRPSIRLDQVVLYPKTSDEVRLVINMIQGKTAQLLRKWGIAGSHLNPSPPGKNRGPSVTLLLHGPPGTGKTLTAHAMASALKRVVLTLDCSQVVSKWVGQSEENTRKIFDRYKKLSKGMKHPPVLLLNEADQFFHGRIEANRSVDHMYNQMQNLFLEQMERFQGILIATTNLVENIDSAFSRRFHFKIELRRPLPDERWRLWQIHLPPEMPFGKDVDLRDVAERYDLSGGQIAVALRNAAARAAMRGDCLHQWDLFEACESEVAGNFDEG